MKKTTLAALAVGVVLVITGCEDDATIASRNLSKAADMFEISRRIVFYNGITGEWILNIEGRCSIEVDGSDRQLEVTCKVGDQKFWKHFLGLSDNVTYFAEQLAPVEASVYHYRIIFKPQSIIPDVDARGSLSEGIDK